MFVKAEGLTAIKSLVIGCIAFVCWSHAGVFCHTAHAQVGENECGALLALQTGITNCRRKKRRNFPPVVLGPVWP